MTDTGRKPVCIDFDGVIHSYTSGWRGIDRCDDPPTEGAIEWLRALLADPGIEPLIYSSRSKDPVGLATMRAWFERYLGPEEIARLGFPTQKPAAFLTIDDRAICFRGTFPTVAELHGFKTWMQVPP